MKTKILWAIAALILIASYATRPHGLLGQIGTFLAGLAILGLSITECIRLYQAHKEQQ